MLPWSPWSRDDEKRIAEMSAGVRAAFVIFGLVILVAILLFLPRALN